MTTKTSVGDFKEIKMIARVLCGALVSLVLSANSYAAPTALSTEPFATTDKITALPNIMFVLDDSGSMRGNFLPDWAGPYLAADNVTVLTPAHRFFNAGYNGVAYNPATHYRAPVMYTNAGLLDTTTYPSQTGMSEAEGADASAKPNWKAVKVDGYGVQSTSTVNLEGNAFSYTTVPGEYCNSAQLKSCIAASAPSGAYTFPAKLRWCHDAADTTTSAGAGCQASNISDTTINATNGVTHYTFARMPRPRTATITVAVAGTGAVTSITVDGQQILSDISVSGATTTDLATAIKNSINACTLVKTGSVCSGVGYSATSSSNVVTVTAPGAISVTPLITTTLTTAVSATAFTGGNVPGASLLTVITPTVTSYPRAAKRIDCTTNDTPAVPATNSTPAVAAIPGTTCTFAEEMTNYANWNAYYRTRMQMMKSASSIAFSSLDDKFRVGYYSINDGVRKYDEDNGVAAASRRHDILEIKAFDGVQKYNWYKAFFGANPYGATPLRNGLANVGRMYAGTLSTLNTVSVADPMQYSCQQNFTILSTDGYWNDASVPTQINGTEPIGNQDGNLNRPYYDGAVFRKTVSQTWQSFEQKLMNTFFVESKTSQLQTSTTRLSKVDTTTTTQPWKLESSQLQSQTKQLRKSTYALESRTYPLKATTKVLRENTFNPQSTTRPLEKSTFMLTETSTPLKKTITKIVSMTYPLQVGTEQTIATTTPLQKGTQATYATTTPLQRGTQSTYATTTPLQRGTQSTYATTTPLQKGVQATYATTTPLQRGTQAIFATISPLQSTTYKLQSVNYQLQKRSQVSTDGGDTYLDTGWVDVTSGSCTTYVGVKGDPEKNVTCRYSATGTTGGLSNCTKVDPSPASPYSVRVANTCSYETTPTVASSGTCAVVPQSSSSPYLAQVTCGYGTAAAAAPAATCTANDQAGASSMSGDKVVCSLAATPSWANAASCTPANENYAGGTGKISCRYDPLAANTTTSAAGATCSANDQTSSLATLGASISGNKVVCSVAPVASTVWTDSATCSPADPIYSTGTGQVSCRYDPVAANTTTSAAGATCSANDQTSSLATLGASISGNKVACSIDPVASTVWANAGTCTPANQNYATGAGKITCRYDPDAANTTKSAPGATCTARDQTSSLATLGAAISGNKVVCSIDPVASTVWVNAATCSRANQNYATGAGRITCRYDPLAANTTTSAAGVTCSANDQTGSLATLGASISGNKVVCSVAPVASTVWTNSATCTPADPVYSSGTGKITCRYDPLAANTTTSAAGATCSANDQTSSLATTGASISGNKVVCSVAPVASTVWTNSATCTPADPVYSSGTGQITCRYDPLAANTTTSAAGATCSANDQTSSLTTLGASISGNKVACSVAATPTWANAASCSPANPVYSTGTAQVSCRYDTAHTTVSAPGSTCVANDQSGLLGTIGASIIGDQVICSLNSINWVDATGTPPTCTPAAANYATGASAISCRYRPTADATKTLINLAVCTPYSQPTNAAMTGNQVTCAYQGSAYSTTTESTCQWTSSATAETERVTCAYDTSANTVSGAVSSCSTVAQSTGTAEGTNWSGPAKACAYRTAVIDTNQPNCTHSGSLSAGPDYSSYVTCGYGSPVVTSASSCAASTPESGPDYIKGSTVACTYLATPTSTSGSVGSCTWVAPSATWATPAKTCTYDTAATATASSCTEIVEGTGGTGTYSGPATTCAYSLTPSLTNLSASSCTTNRQTASPFTAATAVDCSFNAVPTIAPVTACTVKDEAGPAYTGAKVACNYDSTFGGWADVATCNAADQSAAAGPAYAEWRECRYNPKADTYGGTCTGVAASTSPTYTVSNPVTCVPGAYVVSSVASAPTIVDFCATGTVTTGDVNGTPRTTQVDVATTCAYQASPTVATATSCTEHLREASSPYTTEVTCPYTTGGWVKAATTAACVPIGTQPAPASMLPADFVGGKNVQCKITEPAVAGTGTIAHPLPDPSCTVSAVTSIDLATSVQTNCVLSPLSTLPTAIQPAPANPNPCVATIGLPTGPDYIKTICDITTTDSNVGSCTPQTATAANFWQTITCPVVDGTGTSNTLADVAAYYYYTDLRTPGLGNCTGAIVSPATVASTLCSASDEMNDVFTTPSDPLKTQHMTTFTLGLGASGYMQYADNYMAGTSSDFNAVYGTGQHTTADVDSIPASSGACSWQSTGNCNWPYPPDAGDEQTTIDDLWHAGVNGHGAYFSASEPKSLAKSISGALEQVRASGGAGAAPTVSNPSLPLTDSFIFSTTYKSLEWTGDLFRKQLNPYTASPAPSVDWSAQSKLDAKAPASRSIYTFDSSVASTKLKAFTSANFASNAYFLTPHISTAATGGLTQFVCATTDSCLSDSDQGSGFASGANLVEFLRGDRSNEETTTELKYYRQRQHVLGDMVNAQVAYVSKPRYNYADKGYSTFVSSQATRQPVVYAGANDGMLHAFVTKGSAATELLVTASALAASKAYLDPTQVNIEAAAAAALLASNAVGGDATIGQELWAYIPSMLMPNLYKLADKKYKDKHRYYVDGTPVVGDICTADCNLTTATWKTMLVGGLGRGGRGFYALDITDPASPKALWEFTDVNLGYSYGTPEIVKQSDGTWVVLLTSGYNNILNDDGAGGDGVGRLYVLNAATGALIRTLSTGVGSTTTPSGLAQITAQVVNPVSDNTVEAVYGGDLLGNLWRFDINDTVGAAGYDAQLLALFKDGTGKVQPVTTKPQVSLIPKVNAKIVFVGTGRFLASADVGDTSQQTLYAIKDVRANGTTPETAIFNNPGGTPRVDGTNSLGFVNQALTEIDCPAESTVCDPGSTTDPVRAAEKVRKSENLPVAFLTDSGWFVDLIGTGERANTDPALDFGEIVYNTNEPSLLSCYPGGKSYQYWLDFLTGGAISAPGTNGVVGKSLANALASKPTLVVSGDGSMKVITGLNCTGDDCLRVTDPPQPPLLSTTRRTSWRELIRE